MSKDENKDKATLILILEAEESVIQENIGKLVANAEIDYGFKSEDVKVVK